MAPETQKTNFEKYAYASIAAQMAQSQEDQMYLYGATELLRKNLSFGEDGGDLYKGFVANEEGEFISKEAKERFINVYLQKFIKKQSEAKPSEILEWYLSNISGISEDLKKLAKSEFNKFGEKSYGQINEKLSYLNYIANEAPENEVGKEQKEKAKKEMQKYLKFVGIDKILKSYTFENLRSEAVKESKKKNLKNLEKILKEENQNEGH